MIIKNAKILLLILVVVFLIIYTINNMNLDNNKTEEEPYIYSESYSYSPPSKGGGSAGRGLILYQSGQIIVDGPSEYSVQLQADDIEKIKNFIRETGIMKKDCSDHNNPTRDVKRTYDLRLDGKEKMNVVYSDCQSVLDQISEYIWSFAVKKD